MSKEFINKEFFDALKALVEEKGIPADYMFEKIQAAIISATRNQFGNRENVVCDIDPDEQSMRVYVRIPVMEADEIEEPAAEWTVEQAAAHGFDKAKIGDILEYNLDPMKFGRIVAQTAKSVIRQGIREAEREKASQEFQSRNQEAVTATVKDVNPETLDCTIEIGHASAFFPRADQLPNDHFRPGQLIKVYVASITENGGVGYANISRRHPGFVKRLFETQVPEIYDGVVEIVSVSREAGSRTKIAVSSKDENVEPIGSCIGPKGSRINQIIQLMGGEKIDVVKYSDNPVEFISAALSPAEIVSVEIVDEETRSARVTVPENQLSLAIGNKGQNARLAARLTGWKIDIKPYYGNYQPMITL